jgi:translation initiation factor 2B subunit (eIF-2B alpha/beta/delta family)
MVGYPGSNEIQTSEIGGTIEENQNYLNKASFTSFSQPNPVRPSKARIQSSLTNTKNDQLNQQNCKELGPKAASHL